MAFKVENWQKRGPATYHSNQIITLQGRIYHSIVAFVPPEWLCPTYLSLYIHGTYFKKQSSIQAQNCDPRLLRPVTTALAKLLQQHISYVQYVLMLREFAFGEQKRNSYEMIIYAEKAGSRASQEIKQTGLFRGCCYCAGAPGKERKWLMYCSTKSGCFVEHEKTSAIKVLAFSSVLWSTLLRSSLSVRCGCLQLLDAS